MWDEAIKIKVCEVANRRLETIDDVTETLEQMGSALEGLADSAGCNPIRAFNQLYLQITLDVKQRIIDGSFNDSHFVEVLDIEFAQLYIDALECWSRGGDVPASWSILFQLEHCGERHTDFEGALLGVNAHINRDLTYALVNAVGRVEYQDDFASRRSDYDQINEIFKDQLNPIVDALLESLPTRHWALIWEIVDKSLGPIDEWIIFQAIIAGRNHAWERFENIWALPSSQKVPIQVGRCDLSTFLARLTLGSHLFDRGVFQRPEGGDVAGQSVEQLVNLEFDSVVPESAEVLFKHDLLDMNMLAGSVAVTTRSQGSEGSWQGERQKWGLLFGHERLLGTIAAESDAEIQEVRQGLTVLYQTRGQSSIMG